VATRTRPGLAEVAESTCAAALHRERAERCRQDREAWRMRLGQYLGTCRRPVAELDGWWSPDDPAEYKELRRWPVILDDAVRAPPARPDVKAS
jgi:hypothetical protein